MTGPLPGISVIVVSHGRPAWLARCVTSLGQLDYPSFEIVVVADTDALEWLADHPLSPWLKRVAFDTPNISEARNAGLARAAGDLVAFIDDDAVAEPMWLRHHADAFSHLPGLGATTGFVRGRNGISYQTAVTSVDDEGETHREPPGDGRPFVPKLKGGRALKLVGTNSVYRRDTLAELGGFDPVYRFFLDDTDLSLRLARAGHRAAVVPLAQVHHAFAPSVRRTRLRAPRDLTEIGRSAAIFALRYRGAPPDELKERLFTRERARLIAHMVRGTCEPDDVGRSMRTLAAGWREGSVLHTEFPRPRDVPAGLFRPVPACTGPHLVLSSRLIGRRAALRRAARHVSEGGRASVFSFSATIFRHHVRFVAPGIWLQTGGIFGRSVRTSRRYRWCRFADRVKEEIRRVALVRGIGEVVASPEGHGQPCQGDNQPVTPPGAGGRQGTKGQS